ncbi:DDE-type integrase/transposase/recombinase [Paracoccus fontiphilus]
MPDQLWVSDLTSLSSWQGPRHALSDQGRSHGSIHVALVIDVLARKIVGGRVSTSMATGFVLDALNQAICRRAPSEAGKLVHHGDRGSQHLSIPYTERLAEAGIDTSAGSVGGSHGNALAESIIGLFRTEVIKFLGPWKSVGQVAWETLKRIDWHHTTGLHRAIVCVTPNEAEGAVHASLNADEKAASSMKQKRSGKPGAVHSGH